MQNTTYKTIGIIGGVGSLATADLFSKILASVPALGDQDYPHIIIDNDPSIPDRTAAILAGGESPVPALTKVGKRLTQAGAQVLSIPCNTAHAFFDELQASVEVPLVNMIDETVAHIKAAHPDVRRVGVLATSGTRAAAVYDVALARCGLTAIHVADDVQARV